MGRICIKGSINMTLKPPASDTEGEGTGKVAATRTGKGWGGVGGNGEHVNLTS